MSVDDNKAYIIQNDLTKSLIETIPKFLSSMPRVLTKINGQELSGLKYYNPFLLEYSPFLNSDHVTAKQGTGLVHIAPAFGHDDFKLAVRTNLKTTCSIDENGFYNKTDENLRRLNLSGKNALDENVLKLMEDILEDKILHKHEHIHSYPYDWRTKKPVIIRSSQQWFLNTDKLKDRALELLKTVKIRPSTLSNSMISTLSNRSYWCISRQRVWGLPIPCLYDPSNDTTEIIDDNLVDNFKNLVKLDGNADFWWSNKYDKELNVKNYKKSRDILDIWFDSGSSFNSVLNDDKQADLYCEGIDQFSGWFQASLLLSTALNNKAPYKSILVHGFVVDENNQKMSKSIGNIIEPMQVIKGFSKKKIPQCGNDVLRFWLLSEYHKNNIPIGADILDKIFKRVFEMRSIIRHLLANINDFKIDQIVDYNLLYEPDKYLLHQLNQLVKQTVENYEDLTLNKILTPIEAFLLVDVSGFYIKYSKDRLYCEHKNSFERKSAQTVMFHAFEKILIMLAPVLPHLTEEAFRNSNFYDKKPNATSLFQSNLSFKDILNQSWYNKDIENLFQVMNHVKASVNSIIKSNNSALYDVSIQMDNSLKSLVGYELTKKRWLADFFGCSKINLEFIDLSAGTIVSINSKDYKYNFNATQSSNAFSCARCRRYINDKDNCLCDRCLKTIEIIDK